MGAEVKGRRGGRFEVNLELGCGFLLEGSSLSLLEVLLRGVTGDRVKRVMGMSAESRTV